MIAAKKREEKIFFSKKTPQTCWIRKRKKRRTKAEG
jgi:hypothetical protein